MRRRNGRPQRRRGFSQIITSVMLITAVALMGSFLVSWSTSTFSTQQNNISTEVNSRVNKINESFIIEDVWFYIDGSKYANVTIRNTGEVTMNVTHIFVNNTQAWTGGQIVKIGGVEEIKVPTNWGAGKPQNIWVHTKLDSDVKQTWKAP